MEWICISCFLVLFLHAEARLDRPRGVSLTKKVFYNPDRDFTCLDGQLTIPFSQVNDDYCDCADGSDEPGTSACPKGVFHCTNAGFKPLNIPSSRVNDRICDCCDGTDEWKNEGLCPDNCKDLWKSAREDLIKQADAAKRGYEIREQYMQRGKGLKQKDEEKLNSLLQEVETLKGEELELRLKKEDAEKAEIDAKSVEQIAWDDFRAKIQEHQETRQAADAFTELDVNKDGSISVEELRTHAELDPNSEDGAFTDDEINIVLGGLAADAPHFIEVVWKNIGTKFVTLVTEPVEPTEHPDKEQEEEEEEDDDEEFPDDDDEDIDGDYEDDLDDDGDDDPDEHEEEKREEEENENVVVEPAAEIPQSPSSLPDEPVWNELTQAFIRTADQAREEHKQNEKRKSDIEREISSLQKTLAMDFGPDQSYHELHGQCFNFDTHEYTYKLCPFDKVAQIPKHGGSETSLGRWGSWNGAEDKKYSSMKYPNGLKCWNGPERSTEVKISCGDENRVTGVSEPSRCEYRFEFITPAACEPIHIPDGPHDEL